jgi:hydroxybutyrate-dimer hydrolase
VKATRVPANPATGAALTAASVPSKTQSDPVRAGIAVVQLDVNLHSKPTVIVAGRGGALVAIGLAFQ